MSLMSDGSAFQARCPAIEKALRGVERGQVLLDIKFLGVVLRYFALPQMNARFIKVVIEGGSFLKDCAAAPTE